MKEVFNMVKVSVIIPHYNSAKKLIRLLNTIEDSEDIEIIVIDDKSTETLYDLEQQILKRDNTIILNNSSENKGAGVSRNIGLEAATGDWLLFADADDYFLENAWSLIRSNLNATEDIIYFAPTSIESDTGNESERHTIYEALVNNYLIEDTRESELSLRTKFIVPWSKLIKRSLITENKIYFDEILVSNDMMFSVKTGLLAESINAESNSIYCATKDSNTLSTAVSIDKFKIRTDTYIKYHKFLQENLTLQEYRDLKIYAAGWLFKGLSQKISFGYLINTYRVMKRNKILIAPADSSILKRIIENIKSNLKERRYLK